MEGFMGLQGYTNLNSNLEGKFYSNEMRLWTIRTIHSRVTVRKAKLMAKETHCQKVSGSPSRRHSAPNPNLYEDTDHFPRLDMSGQGKVGNFL